MPKISHAYSTGIVRALERTLFSEQTLSRLVAAPTVAEVAKILTELEWGEMRTKQDIERQADQHVLNACAIMKENSADDRLTNCFLLKYDFLNLKVLLKARMLGMPSGELSRCGVIDPGQLAQAVEEQKYEALPEIMAEVMVRIEERIQSDADPLYVDAELDKAYAVMIHTGVKHTSDKPVKAYFTAWAELTNLIMALRCALMGKDEEMLKALLLEGGEMSESNYLSILREPERAHEVIKNRPYAERLKEALSMPLSTGSVLTLERERDDYLIGLIRAHRYVPASVLPLIGYFLAREREASAVRLIATAKAAHVDQEHITERLRELYA